MSIHFLSSPFSVPADVPYAMAGARRASGARPARNSTVRKNLGLERPLVWLPPGPATVEITTRTQQGRFLIAPSPDCVEIVEGVLGRAQEHYPEVELHGYRFLSNHYNLLLTIPNALAMSRFMQFVNGNLSRELGRLHAWPNGIWGRRYRWIPVVDADAMVSRFRYLLAQGTKEGLVARTADWPGASSLRAHLTGEAAVGVWFDRTREFRARYRGEKFEKYDYAKRIPIKLAPLPCWANLTEAEQRERVVEMVAGIDREAVEENARLGRTPMGVDKVLRVHPHDSPSKPAKSPAPMVHATSDLKRQEFWGKYLAFVEAFRAAADRLKEGILEAVAEFPAGCFLPRFPFRAASPRDERPPGFTLAPA